MTNCSVLVTGAKGFTGPYVVKELEKRGYLVKCLTSNIMDKDQVQAEIKSISPTFCIHLAGISFTQHLDFDQVYNVNLIGALNVLSALKMCNVSPKAVLIASTGQMYRHISGKRINETTPVKPHNHYSVSKLAMEYAAEMFSDSLSLIIARPFNYTGIGQSSKFLIPKIVNHFKERSGILKLGNLDVRREFNDVRDIARIYVDLILSGHSFSSPINICSGMGVSIRDVVEYCKHVSKHSPLVEIDPLFIRKNEPDELIGNPEFLESLVPLPVYDIKSTLKWMLSGKDSSSD